jgi:hypothetical protein
MSARDLYTRFRDHLVFLYIDKKMLGEKGATGSVQY